MSKSSDNVKAWRKRIKEVILSAMGGKCQICEYSKCATALELHHVDASKKDHTISSMIANPKRWIKIAEELSKCMLVCNRCHRELHSGIMNLPKEFKKYEGELESFYEFRKASLLKHKLDICPICKKTKRINKKSCSYKCRNKKAEKTSWPETNELKRLVWEIPTSVLAKKLGVSDKAIEKRCKKLEIQKPPRGYWRVLETKSKIPSSSMVEHRTVNAAGASRV
jgi:hypothetical protein